MNKKDNNGHNNLFSLDIKTIKIAFHFHIIISVPDFHQFYICICYI